MENMFRDFKAVWRFCFLFLGYRQCDNEENTGNAATDTTILKLKTVG